MFINKYKYIVLDNVYNPFKYIHILYIYIYMLTEYRKLSVVVTIFPSQGCLLSEVVSSLLYFPCKFYLGRNPDTWDRSYTKCWTSLANTRPCG